MNHEPIQFLPVNKFWEGQRAAVRDGFNSGFVLGAAVGAAVVGAAVFLFAGLFIN